MTTRTTEVDVRNALYRLVPSLSAALPPGSVLDLQVGSPSNGRAWRLYYTPPGESGLHELPGSPSYGYLGWSAAEALLTLTGISWGLTLGATLYAG